MNKMIFILNIWLVTTQIQFSQNNYPKNYFSSPVDIKIAIAGTFGELRKNHFHSGIDIKTKQKINIPIYASQAGYISRIKVSPFGFGKTLYINHPNGYTTVYAHLENFNKEITEIAHDEHFRLKKNEIDFSLKKNQIIVEKGELIAFSGNSGSSTGPHLHFEIRETKTQKVLNPMLFGFPILDITKPVINSILVYDDSNNKRKIDVEKVNGKYTISDKLVVDNYFNMAINTIDYLDAAPNKCGVYTINLFLNDSLCYKNKMEKFSFSETRYINSHIDYEYFTDNGERFIKCFKEPNNLLSTSFVNFDTNLGENLKIGNNVITIDVFDSYDNKTTLTLNVIKNSNSKEYEIKKIKNKINHKQVFEFKNNDIEIYIPNNSLYSDINFTFSKSSTETKFAKYSILEETVPIHKPFVIRLNADSVSTELRSKSLIARVQDEKLHCIKSYWDENKITGKSNSFGDFTIVIDTIKPDLKFYKRLPEKVLFSVKDDLSGIKDYVAKINGEWTILEYDYKNELLVFYINNTNLSDKVMLEISVSDLVNNNSKIFYKIN